MTDLPNKIKYYHVTSKDNIDSIKKYGLLTSPSDKISDPNKKLIGDYVYCATDKNFLKSFIKTWNIKKPCFIEFELPEGEAIPDIEYGNNSSALAVPFDIDPSMIIKIVDENNKEIKNTMKEKNLKEKSDFSFSLKDFDEVTKKFEQYIKERLDMYNALFIEGNYTEDDLKEYIHYFITPLFEDLNKKPSSPELFRIQHFIDREYEFFVNPDVAEIIAKLTAHLYRSVENIKRETFIEDEEQCINELIDLWQAFYDMAISYPYIMIDNFKQDIICGVSFYHKEGVDKFILETYGKFIADMAHYFPKMMKGLDAVILVDSNYIEFVAGSGTWMFYDSETIFAPEKIVNDDKNFFQETLFHEMGHYCFQIISEASQILWYDNYDKWIANDLKLTRDTGQEGSDKLEVEELFADMFSFKFSPIHDFIQEPATDIQDTFLNILEEEFK